jgi:hypothetical protein
MPLQLNRSSCAAAELPQRIQWDPAHAMSRTEALGRINALMARGFTVKEQHEDEMLLVPPPRDPHQILLRILDDNGDSRLLWDRRKLAECEDARQKFDEYLKKGYRAYVCRSDGSKGARVETFDALLEEVIVAAAAAGDKPLGEFVPPPPTRDALLVPPTHPG